MTDMPGAFLHADMEQDVHMLLEGTIAKLIVKLYRKFVWKNKHGKPILYVIKKITVWALQVVLLCWRLLSDTLIEWGFKLNEYNKCVTNKTINGKQCTIIWHVDNLNISHMEKKVVDHIIDKLTRKFGEYSPLSTSTGKKLEYSNMKFDYMTKGKVMLSMYEYIDKMLTELPPDMNGVSKVPATGH